MARLRRAGQLAALALSISTVSARPDIQSSSGTTAAASSTSSASSITSAAADALTTAVVPVYLWSIAESLLTHYYPTTTPLNLQDVTFPATVVIGSVTYKSQPAAAVTTSHSAPSDSSSAAKKSPDNKDQKGDKKLGIIIGAVVGAVAIAIMAVLFCCLRRRKKRTGSFFMRRSTPSMSSGSSRRPVTFGTNTNSWADAETAQHHGAPALAAAALHHHQSSRSTSEDLQFVPPAERSFGPAGHHELDATQPSELDHVEPAERRSFTTLRDGRPPTPFMMQQMRGDPSQQQMRAQSPVISPLQTQHPNNPFASPEDREADDVVSPIVPPKSWSRRDSPVVHYPSLSEVTSFDFSDDGKQPDGGDGWRPPRNRTKGWHEMA